MDRARWLWIALLWLLAAAPVLAQGLMMVRSQQAFPEAMLVLQQSIRDHGYSLSRVQRVDIGLTGMGFETDKYRVVFFGKIEEVRAAAAKEPLLLAYLPLNVSIYAEENQTVLVAPDPAHLGELFTDPELVVLFQRWSSDMRSIMDDVRSAQ